MKPIGFVTALLLSFLNLHAQTNPGKISLTITNAKNAGIENASAALLKNNSKQLVQTAIANKEGKILFENLLAGTYRIKVSAIGYEEKTTDSIILSESNWIPGHLFYGFAYT